MNLALVIDNLNRHRKCGRVHEKILLFHLDTVETSVGVPKSLPKQLIKRIKSQRAWKNCLCVDLAYIPFSSMHQEAIVVVVFIQNQNHECCNLCGQGMGPLY